MTIAATLTFVQLPANGVATQFSFGNKIFAATDLQVTLIDPTGNLYPFVAFTNVTLGLSYTVQGVDVDTGCFVVFSGPPTNLWKVDIRTLTPEVQATSIKNQGAFLPELHEEAFDRLTREVQDLLRIGFTFSIHGPDLEGTPWPALPLPAARKGLSLVFDGVTGLPVVALPTTQNVTQSLIGGLLWPQTALELAAGVLPPNLFDYPPIGVDVRRFGVVGNGVTDDTAAMLLAISTSQPLDIGNLSVRITSRLTFNKNSQYVYGRGGQFLWDGPFNDRMIQVTANDVRFEGVKFNGNAKQVLACLIYLASNAARPRFLHCWFTNINGTHITGVQNNSSNSQYALMISPYGVEGFDFNDCIFDEIYNDNSGINVAAATGGGFCGGIFTLTDDFAQPVTAQGIPTSGQIGHCLFKNIKTILAGALSVANQQNFNDADGIRFYGDNSVPATQTKLHVQVHDCVFYDCAKRAIKGSVAQGVKVSHINVIATAALQYPMVTAIKVDGDDFQLRGMNVYSPLASPVSIVIQTHDGKNLRVDGIFADRCGQFWAMTPTSTAVIISGWRVSNLRCANILLAPGGTAGLGITSDTFPDHFEDCIFENVTFEADSTIHTLLAGSFIANTNRMEVVLKNWRIVNGDLKIAGYGYMLQSIYHEMTDTAYVSSAANRGILEAGQTTGTATTRDSVVDGYEVNIKAITVGYLSVTRQYFTLIYGDRVKVSRFRLWVPETYDITWPHAQFDGAEYVLENFDYSAPGSIAINTFTGGTKQRMTIDGARRIGGVASSTLSFLYLYLSEDCSVANVADYRTTTVASITVQSGTIRGGRTFAYVLDGIWSLTGFANVVTDGGVLARQLNVQKF